MALACIGIASRLLLALVFLAAVFTKVRTRSDLAQFRATVRAFGVASRWSSITAIAVIAGELVAASLMLIDFTAVAGLALATVLLGTFTAAIGSALRRGTATSCRCFGASDQPLSVRQVVRNAILLVVTMVALVGTVLAPDGLGGLETAALLLSGFVAVVLAALVIAYDDLLALIRVH